MIDQRVQPRRTAARRPTAATMFHRTCERLLSVDGSQALEYSPRMSAACPASVLLRWPAVHRESAGDLTRVVVRQGGQAHDHTQEGRPEPRGRSTQHMRSKPGPSPPPAPKISTARLRWLASRSETWLRRIWPWVSLAFFALALWSLHRSLDEHSYGDLVAGLSRLPGERLALALGLTLAGYVVLIGYDILALRYIRRPTPLRHVAIAALLSNALATTSATPC